MGGSPCELGFPLCDTLIRMNNNEIPKPIPKPEQEPKGHPRTSMAELSPTHTEQAPEWLAKYADEPEIPKVNEEECEKKVAELESLMTAFEVTHPIAELYAITDLAVKDAPNHPIRHPAKLALGPIVAAWIFVKERTNISPERLAELKVRYLHLTRAVGMIEAKTSKVDHDR